jgi:membrane protein
VSQSVAGAQHHPIPGRAPQAGREQLRQRSFRAIAPGVLFTLAVWIAFGLAFSIYLAGWNTNFSSTYAGLASIVILLIFLDFFGAIFVFGAELNRILAKRSRHEDVTRRLSGSTG